MYIAAMVLLIASGSAAGQVFVDPVTPTEVAITIDDIPGTPARSADATAVVGEMLTAFKKHHLTGIYGMMVGSYLHDHPASGKILVEWVGDGQLLANHTWSHPDLAKITASDFIADLRRNEGSLTELMGERDWHYLRYPFLSEGDSLVKREAVRSYLAAHQYRIAEVTLDFFDYEWIDPYRRCLGKGRREDAAWLRESYMDNALYGLEIAQRLSRAVVGRQIKLVMLLHFGRIQADVMDGLLTSLEQRGVHFVDLAEALADPVYGIDPQVARERSYTFLNQLRLQRGIRNPKRVQELYDLLPEDRLAAICN